MLSRRNFLRSSGSVLAAVAAAAVLPRFVPLAHEVGQFGETGIVMGSASGPFELRNSGLLWVAVRTQDGIVSFVPPCCTVHASRRDGRWHFTHSVSAA